MIRLSHSAIEKYNLCSEKYRLHYREGYRGTTLGSALFFGNAWGEAVQDGAYKGLSLEETKQLFDDLFSTVMINDVNYSLPECEHVRYFKGDLVVEYLTAEESIKVGEETFNNLDELFKVQSEGILSLEYQQKLNLACWYSMRYKAHRLIEAYYKDIIPRIKKVYFIEKEITLETSDQSGKLVGYIDMICDWQNDDGTITKVLFDHKTSSAKYPKNAILTKQQLTIYEYAENIGHVGYIVAIKKPIPKTGFTIQVLIDSIPKDIQEKHVDTIDEALYNIKQEKFEKNPKGCRAFGQKCEYYDICWNNSDKGLYKKETV